MWRFIIFISCCLHFGAAQNATCGVQVFPPHSHQGSRTARIVGGQESVPHSWPWMVLLRFGVQEITCGGSIVRVPDGTLVVVTAAHCVDGQAVPSQWKIDVGIHSRSAMEINRKEYLVSEIVQHPNFNFQFLDDDIAIMKTTTPIQINDYVQPICLTGTPSEMKVGQECVVIGWGATAQGGSPVDRLNEVYKPIIADRDCAGALSVFGYNNVSMMCAGNLIQGGVDACSFDSGVPFACKNSVSGAWELVGISSWGFGCAQPGYPGVYTDVYNFIQWFNANSQTPSSAPPVG